MEIEGILPIDFEDQSEISFINSGVFGRSFVSFRKLKDADQCALHFMNLEGHVVPEKVYPYPCKNLDKTYELMIEEYANKVCLKIKL